MHIISPEGVPYRYFTKEEPFYETEFDGKKVVQVGDDWREYFLSDYNANPNNMRVMLVDNSIWNYRELYILHWLKDIDLDALDAKVRTGIASPDEFKLSLATVYYIVFCTYCFSRWRVLVLGMRSNTASIPFGEVLDLMSGRYNEVASCPSCGKRFRIPVIKIFGPQGHIEPFKQSP